VLHLALVCHQRQALPGQLLGSLSLLARKTHLEMTILVMKMVVVMVLGTMTAMSRAGTFRKIVFLCRRAQDVLLAAALVADLEMAMTVVMTIAPTRTRVTNLMRFPQFLLRILRLGRGSDNHMKFLLALRFGTGTMMGRPSLVGRQRSSNSLRLRRLLASKSGGLLPSASSLASQRAHRVQMPGGGRSSKLRTSQWKTLPYLVALSKRTTTRSAKLCSRL